MKSVLISIQPKWCELIASGKKTVDVRKTRPKLETPFKVYIYCTKDNTFAEKTLRGFSDDGKAIYYKANKGKVIGEFVCDDITRILNFITRFGVEGRSEGELNTIAQCSCLDYMDMLEYFGTDKGGYAWHISDLVIYEKPKELWEFAKPDKCPYNSPIGCTYAGHCYRAGQAKRCGDYVERPPQSWCYVEEGD
jgi:predicted transcriptional regulator